MKRILLALSGSDVNLAAEAALDQARACTEAEIVALYVIDEEVPSSVSSWLIYVGFMGDKPSEDYRHTILKEYRRRAEEDLTEVQGKLASVGCSCRTRLEEGPLLTTMKRVSLEEKADLLLISLPRKSDVGAALYHDAARALHKEAPCEVKIVGAG